MRDSFVIWELLKDLGIVLCAEIMEIFAVCHFVHFSNLLVWERGTGGTFIL